MSKAVLIIDDEVTLANNIMTYLKRHGFDARAAYSGGDGLAEYVSFKPDIILLDYKMDDVDGIEVLAQIRRHDKHVKVILMTGYGDVQIAVKAMKAGAQDYISKPVVLAEIKSILERLTSQSKLEGVLAYYQDKQVRQSGLDKILGQSPQILGIKDRIRKYIETEGKLIDGKPPAVLVTGETGTGKALVARAFHFEGSRADNAFVEINCASIPEDLLEAELFGYEKGAFTGAGARKLGLVETAEGGTLFLDEIGELSLSMQTKLLKLLEDQCIRAIGGLRQKSVDVRIITATNQDLENLIQQKAFRADLYFRLRVIQVHLPPLRERGKDVVALARQFLRSITKRYRKTNVNLSKDSEKMLENYTWPGNIRELRNVIEHAVLLTESGDIEKKHIVLTSLLESDCQKTKDPWGSWALDIPKEGIDLEKIEQELIVKALEYCAWNVTNAAKFLRLSRDTLRYRMEKHNIKSLSKPLS